MPPFDSPSPSLLTHTHICVHTQPSGSPAGFVQLSLKWKHPYHTQNTVPSPGSASTKNNETPHVNTSTVPSHVAMERPPSHVPMETPSNLVSMETPSSCVAMETSSNHITTKTPSTTTTAVEKVSTREAPPKKFTNLRSLTAEATKKATDDDEKLSSKESERGEACDTGDSVSVTVTECSVEEEEVIEESLSGEDTMFEETIPQADSTAGNHNMVFGEGSKNECRSCSYQLHPLVALTQSSLVPGPSITAKEGLVKLLCRMTSGRGWEVWHFR